MEKKDLQTMLNELLSMVPPEGIPYAQLVEQAEEARIAPALRSLRRMERAKEVAFRFVGGVNTVFKGG